MTSTKSPTILIPRAATTGHPDGTIVEVDAVVDALLLGRDDRVHEGPTSWDAILVRAYRRLAERHRTLVREHDDTVRWGKEREEEWKERYAAVVEERDKATSPVDDGGGAA